MLTPLSCPGFPPQHNVCRINCSFMIISPGAAHVNRNLSIFYLKTGGMA
jgi:hypothetical protein